MLISQCLLHHSILALGIALLVFEPVPAIGQSCFPDEITLATQAEIDAFAENYPDCQHIGGTLNLGYIKSSDIISLAGLSRIRSIGGDLIISDIAGLKNLSGLDALVSIGGSLRIASNKSLTSLQGLEQLAWIGNSLNISSNRMLQSLAMLGPIKEINGDLSISECDALENLHGLQSINFVGGHLIINSNERLFNLEGLHGLMGIGEDLLIQGNLVLHSLEGLVNLDHLGESLIIDSNNELLDINALNGMGRIGKNLQITNNPALLSVRGLRSIYQMNGLLQIFNNPQLTNLIGLDSLSHEGIQDLAIIFSPMLSSCQAKSICNYLKISSNSWSINNNDNGCNSREEVLKLCPGDGGNSTPPRRGKSVFVPNPTSGLLYVRGDTAVGDRFQVIDMTGQKVLQGLVNEGLIDLSNVSSGCYFVEYISMTEVKVEAIIKVE